MKNLIFTVPVQLKEDGTLFIKKMRSLRLMVSALKDRYEITLLVQSFREKSIPALTDWGIAVIYDNSVPEYQADTSQCSSRFQSSCLRWAGRKITTDKEVFRSKYDCLVAWDGCSPWCLATALRLVSAKRRLVWLQDDPNLYLMQTDRHFYTEFCVGFDAILASEAGIKNKLDGIFEASARKRSCTVVTLPVDSAWYWEQSEQPCACEFQEENLNFLAVSGMSRQSALERLPGWLSDHRDHRPPIQCYLLGDGERLDRYIQQIAIYSVDDMVTLAGHVENPYPYIRRSDALLISEEERQPDLESAAQIFGVPVISFEETEQRLPELKKKKSDEPSVSVWQDRDKLIKILKETSHPCPSGRAGTN